MRHLSHPFNINILNVSIYMKSKKAISDSHVSYLKSTEHFGIQKHRDFITASLASLNGMQFVIDSLIKASLPVLTFIWTTVDWYYDVKLNVASRRVVVVELLSLTILLLPNW